MKNSEAACTRAPTLDKLVAHSCPSLLLHSNKRVQIFKWNITKLDFVYFTSLVK